MVGPLIRTYVGDVRNLVPKNTRVCALLVRMRMYPALSVGIAFLGASFEANFVGALGWDKIIRD